MKIDLHHDITRLLLLGALLVGLPLSVQARELTPDQALNRACSSSAGGARKAPAMRSMKLIYNGKRVTSELRPSYYVFGSQKGEGFIITSADDQLQPILGMSDQGRFDAANMPENMRWWLGQYEAEIAAYYEAAALKNAAATSTTNVYDNYDQWEPIEPIVKTTWNQGEPYNNLCPTDDDGNLCVTGCVATAMAQVIKAIGYYNGKGTHTYKCGTLKNREISFNYESFDCDFTKMKNSYESKMINGSFKIDATAEEIEQVATLMRACGVAVNMSYSPSASGAGYPIQGLINYFGYDPASTMVSRGSMTTAQWESFIYNQLKSGRPMYYSGQALDGGHAFVCDGYSANGFFHINWGWGGQSDGYFLLSALLPANQGIGSFAGGYNHSQAVGVFLKPGEQLPDIPKSSPQPCSMIFQGNLQEPYMMGGNWEYTFSFVHGVSGSEIDFPFNVGVSLVLEDDARELPDIYVKPSQYRKYEKTVYAGQTSNNFTVDFSGVTIPSGTTWHAYPVFSVEGYDGYWKFNRQGTAAIDHFTVTVDAKGGLNFQLAEIRNPGLDTYNFKVNDLYVGDGYNHVECVITNFSKNDLSENISLRLTENNAAHKVVKTLGRSCFFARSGEPVPFEMTFDTYDVTTPGKYRIYVYRDAYNVPLGDNYIEVELKDGFRPGKGKADGSMTSYQIALWENGEVNEHPSINLTEGEKLTATTATTVYWQGQTISYGLKIFAATDTDRKTPLVEQSLVSNLTPARLEWSEGVIFTTDLNLPLGAYSLCFYTSDGVLAGFPIDLNIVCEQDGVVYELADDNKTVKASYVTQQPVGIYRIAEQITSGKQKFTVSELGTGAFDGSNRIETVYIPDNIKTIGVNAFRGCTGLKHVVFENEEIPFPNAAIAFFGVRNTTSFYLPEKSYAAYKAVIPETVGSLYVPITGIKIENAMKATVGQTSELGFTVEPAANTNPEFTVEVADPALISAETEGKSIKVKGLATGSTTMKLIPADPTADPVTIDVKVENSDILGIEEVSGESEAAEYYDMAGRRISTPRGVTIKRTSSGVQKIIR